MNILPTRVENLIYMAPPPLSTGAAARTGQAAL